MKKVKLGSLELEQCETIEDLNIKRWVQFKNEMIEDESGVDVPTLKEAFGRFRDEFDRESKSGMFIAIHDYIHKLTQIEHKTDPSQMMYALITYLPDEIGEKRASTDPTYLKEKLEIFANAGLSQGQVKKDVTDFIRGLLTA